MNITPSPSILAGLVTGLLLPWILALLSHGPWQVSAPGRRFVCAALGAVAGWGLFLAAGQTVSLDDLLASGMIVLTALLVEFSLWMLLAWGFTVSLLQRLAEAERPLTFEEWVEAYTGGWNVDRFAEDRLSLLFRAGLAHPDGQRVCLRAGRAQRLARFVEFLRIFFGVKV